MKDSITQKLIDVNLLTKDQTDTFEKYLEEPGKRLNTNYLYGLYRLELKNLTGLDETSTLGIMRFEFKGSDEDQRKESQLLTNYLSKLKDVGLITGKQYEEQKHKVDSHVYVHILQMLPELSKQSAYEEWLSPNRLNEYAEKLFSNDIVTTEAYNKLKNDINAGKIISNTQLITYCKNTRVFDLAKYSNNPAEYLEQIHKDIATILPELNFSDFSYSLEADTLWATKDYISYHVVISVSANGRNYKQKSFISPKDIGKDGNYLGKIDSHDFYQIFNKILTDQQSPLRLHKINIRSSDDNSMNYRHFGLIALTRGQAQMFGKAGRYIDISYENFKSVITSEQIDSAILFYQKIKLFNHLTPLQVQEAKEKINAYDNRSYNDILAGFPDIVYSFDTELSNLHDPYAELVRGYAKISHGDFKPQKISDDFDIEKKKKVVLRFCFKDKQYQKVFKIEDDWIDSDFFEFLNKITTDYKLSGQFYSLYTGGQDVSIIYLTPDQYNFLKQNKLAVFGDEWEAMLDEE